MKRNFTKFDYTDLSRVDVNGVRHYNSPTGPLPSVTTVLDATQSAEKAAVLENWRNRVGHENAKKITQEAANVGELMHAYLEHWVLDTEYSPGNNMIHRQAKKMANVVIENATPHMDEVWGTEVGLYYPELYAGTTDLVGVWKGKETILDFKQTNKPKKREWIDSYFMQGAAYSLAHNSMYGTNINNITILMCSRGFEMQIFEIDGKREMEKWAEKWARAVDKYFTEHK